MRFKIIFSSVILLGLCLFSGMRSENQTRRSLETPPHGAPVPGDIYSVDPIVGNMRYVPFPGRHFAAMETKVTQGMWAAFAAAEPTFAIDPIITDSDISIPRGPSLALDCVSWNYAVVFANLLSKLNGFTPCYYTDASKSVPIDAGHFLGRNGIDSQLDLIYCDFAANGYRLPRDAEWTYFCQGGFNVRNLLEYGYYVWYGVVYPEVQEEWVWDALKDGSAVEPPISIYGIVKTGEDCAAKISEDGHERWWNIMGFTMRLVRTVSPEITSLTSKYADIAYYLKGPSYQVTHTAIVDWMGHTPGLVRFITSKGQTDVIVDPANPTTASCAIDMGAEINSCATVKAVAIGLAGARSPEKKAGSIVYPPPAPLDKMSFTPYDGGSSFHYTTKNDFTLSLISGGVGASVIPSDIPLFGANAFNLSLAPQVTARATSSGKIEIRPSTANPPSANLNVVGFAFELNQPAVTIDKQMKPDCSSGPWDGTVGLSGSIDRHLTMPFSLLGIPLYLGLTFRVGAGGSLDVKDINPVQYDGGEITLNPTVTGSLGVGVDRILSGEGWAEGGANFTLQYPLTPTLKTMTISLRAGVAATAFGYRWTTQLFSWNWDYYKPSSAGPASSSFVSGRPRLLARDYLKSRSRFRPKLIRADAGTGPAGLRSSTEISALQESVYPHSNPHLSSSDIKMGLVWITDASARSAVNRTTAVSSFYSGTEWSSPVALWENGTADFHARILTFSDGRAIAAWEDANMILADSAELAEMTGSLEISAAVYDPAAGRWGPGARLTSNAYLDATPLLSGKSSSDVMLAWIANESGDLRGRAAAPNKIYWARFNGQTWTKAALAATVPLPIFRYDLIYGEGRGEIVLSCDTDDDVATINDRELYRLAYENGAWGPMTRLTQDAVVDDNPQLIRPPDGSTLLVWVRNDGIYSSANFDLNAKTLIVRDPYSTNLANARISASSNGRVALAWPAPTTNRSDLMAVFYNPANQTWGNPEQLTSDTETEGEIAAAFFGKNTWIGVYNRSAITPPAGSFRNDEAQGAPGPPILIQTDLYMVKWALSEIIVPVPLIQLSRTRLNFGANSVGVQTPAQGVVISNAGTGTLNWTAASNPTWLGVTPASGTGNAVIQVGVHPAGLPAGAYQGTITVADPSAANSPQTIDVGLIVKAAGATAVPFGDFATPIDGTVGVTGAIPVTGWVLDDIGATKVEIWRDPVLSAGEVNSLYYVGSGLFVEGARPDIEVGYPAYPMNYAAGWGYMLLTNFLPNQGNGTYKLYAIASDLDGHQVTLGTKTITCDNAHAVKPFGTIDTPGQGGTASGNKYVNFGWVLTPLPGTVPKDGHLITVYVDSVLRGNLSTPPNLYNAYRADVSNNFPGLNNTGGPGAGQGGPIGAFFLDTTGFANGVHTIFWIAYDDLGQGEGIGSRYFSIANVAGAPEPAPAAREAAPGDLSALPISFSPVPVKTGFDLDAEFRPRYPDKDGIVRIEIPEVNRLEIELGDELEAAASKASAARFSGHMVVGKELRPLPVGSTLDRRAGRFSWMPGPGFLGDYRLVFIENHEGIRRISTVLVRIGPRL